MLSTIVTLWRRIRGLDRIEFLATQLHVFAMAAVLERELTDRLALEHEQHLTAVILARDSAEVRLRMLERKLEGYQDSFRLTEDLHPDVPSGIGGVVDLGVADVWGSTTTKES